MAHRRLRRSVLILVLFTLLAAPWDSGAAASPEPRAARVAAEQPAHLVGSIWNHVVSLWSEIGCFIDPYGACTAGHGADGTAGAQSADEGCFIDPYGRCLAGPGTQAAQVSTDAGCHIDPYGACQPGS